MSTAQAPISDMLVTVKAREVQRGLLAEMRGDRAGIARHFLAAAHLEVVLANDYEQAGQTDMALRSRLSAASCFWRAGRSAAARELIDALVENDPSRAKEAHQLRTELERDYPNPG
ncbi:MAG TPA: hypothetical protein VG013_33865 [Gemmataceae bacterium]|jgi:hypothetical protein|nr:hypothetical protein [Gemmataceae bacterium]